MRLEIDGKVYEREPTETFFRQEVPSEVRRILEKARVNGIRMEIRYGATAVRGFVSRSSGNFKVPVLAASMRATTGVPIVDHMITELAPAAKRVRLSAPEMSWNGEYSRERVGVEEKEYEAVANRLRAASQAVVS